MIYRIASFNMKNFSLATDKDMKQIASIIKEGNFDIIAMQEVLAAGKPISGISVQNNMVQKTALEKSLIGRLGHQWDSFWGDPNTSSQFYPYLSRDSRGEGYAFLWNTNRIELVNVPNNPRIFRNYKTDYGSGAMRLASDPLYGRFKIKRTKIELRLITTHIIFGKPDEDNMKTSFDGGAIALRQHEFDVLAGNIYKRVNDYRKDSEPTVPYTLILGDYNLNLESSGIGKAVLKDTSFFSPDGQPLQGFEHECEVIYTVQSEKTTISKINYVNNYDHFSFNERAKKVVVGWNRIDAVHSCSNHGKSEEALFEQYYRKVSDHVPIVIELSF